jgi:hypothetical protein
MNNKIISTILCITFFIGGVFAQVNSKPTIKVDTVKKVSITKVEQVLKPEPNYQDQITDLNKQISQLSQTIADTKQTFYDSKLNLWNFILTGFGLLIVIAGYFGYKSISDKISEIKTENEKATSKSEEAVKEIKSDLIQRITELKSDTKEFKTEQRQVFEKFEKEANAKIDKGLDLALQNAIEKIMKESFTSELNDLSEQVSELRNRLENTNSSNNKVVEEKGKSEENKFDEAEQDSTNAKNNAFDDKH